MDRPNIFALCDRCIQGGVTKLAVGRIKSELVDYPACEECCAGVIMLPGIFGAMRVEPLWVH